VRIQSAFGVEPVSIASSQVVKSVNAEEAKGKSDISSNRMDMKHRVDQAINLTYGSMNPQLSERTGFSIKDVEASTGMPHKRPR
jgi:CRISPR-associated protein Csd2